MNSYSILGFVLATINGSMFTLSSSMGLFRFFYLALGVICLIYGFYNLNKH